MVLAIIAAVFAVPFFIAYATYAVEADSEYVEDMAYILMMLFLVESVASIWSAAICCRSVCCGRRQTTGSAIPVIYQVQSGQVMMTMMNVAPPPQQQQAALPDMVLPPYPGQGATAPPENAAYQNNAYGEGYVGKLLYVSVNVIIYDFVNACFHFI
ncbi:hypothetical protein NP493_859g01059 [Ridgeia piscesae]|nr:hypothetical protein NP493_859g01059 [Ridgeia piscesae]